MKLLTDLWHQTRLKRYARKLGRALAKNYGRPKHYTAGQIRTVTNQLNYPNTMLTAGFAMYLSRDAFQAECDDANIDADFDTMREDVANLCFNGDTNFKPSDITDLGGAGDFQAGDIGGGGTD